MKMADALKSKLHYIMLMGNDGNQIVIGTDDLAEVSRQSWFRRMTGEETVRETVRYVEREPEVEVEPRRQVRQPVQREPVRQPVQQQRQQPQQQQQPQQRPPQRQVIPTTFLEIPIESMNDNIWESLTEEQQDQYRQKWMGDQ